MECSIFAIRLAEMLLMPIDSQTLGKLYEKAPKKKMPSVIKIPDSIRIKIIKNLLDRGNSTYTFSQIYSGRLDHFYNASKRDRETSIVSYDELYKMLEQHDIKAGVTLLTLFRDNDNRAIELFFSNKIDNVENLYENWKKINWSTNIRQSQIQENTIENQLKHEIVKLTKSNTKLKEKSLQAQKKHENEIDQMMNMFHQRLIQQSNLNTKDQINVVEQVKVEYNKTNIKLVSEHKAEIEKLNNKSMKLEQQLSNELKIAQNYRSMLKVIGAAHFENLTLVASQASSKHMNNDYLYIGVPDSVDRIMEWVHLMKPSRLILIQEITTRYIWTLLMTKIHREGFMTKVVFLSRYELINEEKVEW